MCVVSCVQYSDIAYSSLYPILTVFCDFLCKVCTAPPKSLPFVDLSFGRLGFLPLDDSALRVQVTRPRTHKRRLQGREFISTRSKVVIHIELFETCNVYAFVAVYIYFVSYICKVRPRHSRCCVQLSNFVRINCCRVCDLCISVYYICKSR